MTERTTGLLPVHIFGYPADMPALERLAAERGLWLVEDACEALGAIARGRRAVGARGNLAVFAFYPNKQITTGEGGTVVCPDAAVKERIDSERNQGRAPDMGWLDHDRLGFNYRLDDLACALGVAQLERLDELLAGRARVAALYRRRWRTSRRLTCPARTRTATGAPGSSTSCSCRPGWTATRRSRRCASAGVETKPYLPAIHLMSFYRERFGHREGEFPVCEDVARRSLALPFFGELTEGEIEQVVGALRDVIAAQRSGLTSATKPGSPRPAGAVGDLLGSPARRRARGRLRWTTSCRAPPPPGRGRAPGAPPRPAALAAAPRRSKAGSVASASTYSAGRRRGGGGAPPGPVEVDGRGPAPRRRDAQGQPQERARASDRLAHWEGGHRADHATVQHGDPDDVRARGVARLAQRALEQGQCSLASAREAVVHVRGAAVEQAGDGGEVRGLGPPDLSQARPPSPRGPPRAASASSPARAAPCPTAAARPRGRSRAGPWGAAAAAG